MCTLKVLETTNYAELRSCTFAKLKLRSHDHKHFGIWMTGRGATGCGSDQSEAGMPQAHPGQPGHQAGQMLLGCSWIFAVIFLLAFKYM